MSNAEFKRNFAKVLERAGAKSEAVVRAAAMELLKRVIERSPVGDPSMWKGPAPKGYVGGRFKANWQVAVGVINYGNGAAPDKSGVSAITRGAGTINGFPMQVLM